MDAQSVTLTRIQAMAYRAPVSVPISTSFGTMHNRPAVFLRVEDAEGCFGWGEVFANWPAAGAEHRARLLIEDVGGLALNRPIGTPADLFHHLTRTTHIRALQCGEAGPFRQVIAGLDIAVHDLFARRAGVPVARLLNPEAAATVPCYASGIHVRMAEQDIPRARQDGARAFKVKVGFDLKDDIDRVRALARGLAPGETLFTDANQAWTVSEAAAFLDAVDGHEVGWLEEPLPADAPDAEWARLAARGTPLAGGENIAGAADFSAAIADARLSVIQPDIAKWGGFTGCLAVARQARAAGRRFCPHFLGGGIGLIASAHLLAAAGGDGLLECDANPNPLRDMLLPDRHRTLNSWEYGRAPGLGIDALPPGLSGSLTYSAEITA